MLARLLSVCVLLLGLSDSASALQQGDFSVGPKKHKKVHEDTPAGLAKKVKAHHGKHQKVPDGSTEVLAKVAQPTGRPEKNETAAEATGVAANAAGDLDAFIAALITNIVMIVVFFLIASVLRKKFPLCYSKNTLTLKDHEDIKEEYEQEADLDADVKKNLELTRQEKMGMCAYTEDEAGNKKELTTEEVTEMNEAFFGWWSASARIHIDDVVESRGLDIAMLIEFSHVAMKITATIGLPMVLLIGPCHCFLGGYRAGAPGTADADYLSYWGMANVVDGHPWLYWVHAVIMWLVIIGVQRMLFNAMREFLIRRKDWLKKMPLPRGTTVLVEGIPDEYQSDAKLTEYMNKIFGKGSGTVQTAYVVRDTSTVLPLVKTYDAKKLELEGVEFKMTQNHEDESLKAEKDKVKKELDDISKDLKEAQGKVEAEAKAQVGGVNLSRGFVTFTSRRDAELAKMITYTPDSSEFAVSIPPDPSDVLWKDLQVDPLHEKLWNVVGYALIAGMFWAYLPTVVSIAYFTSLETLAEYSPTFASMAEDPSTAALWDGLVNALALQLLIAFIPTFLVLIFSNFFVLKSGNSLQHKIQEWYFYFQIIFVLLVTAVGSSLLDTLQALAEDPTSVFSLLADTLPMASHFYLNYLPLQWVTHAQNLMRTANLFKFISFSKIFGTAVAVKKSEPEDQDYYGLGSRSARFAFMLSLTLAFCSLSPLINILGFINFWMCRKCYGYLCVFCEIRKPDLGGVFYVSQLTHVSESLFIYIVLMTGVLLERDLTVWPGMIAAGGLIFQYMSYNKFKTAFRWESLCFDDLMAMDEGKGKEHLRESTGAYKQPELMAK